MKSRIKVSHMNAAYEYASLSYAKRRKVGCVIVKDDTIIAIGYNGTPEGWDNTCEDENGVTLPEVIHAEANALDKITRSTYSSEGASVFVTTQPCINCAKRLHGARIKEVFFVERKNTDDGGLAFLKKAGIRVEQINTGD